MEEYKKQHQQQQPVSEHREIKNEQKMEYEQAMYEDQMKLAQAAEKKQEKERDAQRKIQQQVEEEQKKFEKEKLVQSLQAKIPDEPEEGNGDACTLQIRNADGSQTLQRRFLKGEKMELVKHFILTLGEEAGFENEDTSVDDFDIAGGFPPKPFTDLNKTLDELGLFPRAKV